MLNNVSYSPFTTECYARARLWSYYPRTHWRPTRWWTTGAGKVSTIECLSTPEVDRGAEGVRDAMLEKAVRMCEAETAHLLRYDGTAFSRAASLGIEPEFDKLLPLSALR